MKLRKALVIILALALLCTGMEVFAAADSRWKATTTYSNGCPYYIMVNRRTCTVTVFGLDEEGYYSRPVKSMICSTGKPGEETPLGTFSLGSSGRYRWLNMIDGSCGQYATGFWGNYLFHSVCYYDREHDALMTHEYNALGTNVSLGCVRLQVADAKWIYDNCRNGTYVTVYDADDTGPLGRPEKKVAYISDERDNGWDPTDPYEGNPWKDRIPTSVTLDRAQLTLTTGDAAQLTETVSPATAEYESLTWTSSDPKVATVSDRGRVVAVGPGSAVITVNCDGLRATCAVKAEGDALPFTDTIPGEWYYQYIRAAVELELFHGCGGGIFAPNRQMKRDEVLQVLYNMAGRPAVVPEARYEDVQPDAWYFPAVTWAWENSLVPNAERELFAPEEIISREETAYMIYQYFFRCLRYIPDGFVESLDQYKDAPTVSDWATEAVRWAVGNGIINGVSPTELSMGTGTTRAHACTMFKRFFSEFVGTIG